MPLEIELIEDKSIPTICYDGSCIHYNPDFVNTLSDETLTGILRHYTIAKRLSAGQPQHNTQNT